MPNLGDRKTEGAASIGNLVVEAVVAAGRLGPTFDHVSGGYGAGQWPPIGQIPTPPPGSGADNQRCIGDSWADHDVGAAVERCSDTPTAQICVGRDRNCGERSARIEMSHLVAQFGHARQQIVALEVADADVEP